ncbi:MAG: type II secretion system protein [Pseudomonadota bacterium]
MTRVRKKSGFTLIEVLMVVILLNITATIIAPGVSVRSNKAGLSTLGSSSIFSAVPSNLPAGFYARTGILPASEGGHDAL